MSRRKGNAEWKELKKEYWGQNVIVYTREWGHIDFSPQGMKEVFGGKKLTYEAYLDVQMAMGRDIRGAFYATMKYRLALLDRKTMFGCRLRNLRIIKLVIA